jgi:hypothetical protein
MWNAIRAPGWCVLALVAVAGCTGGRSGARAIDATAPVAGGQGGLFGPRVSTTGGVQAFCGASPMASNGAVSECVTGQRCEDRGDGMKVCMGGGSDGAWCVSTADCAFGLMCHERHCRP